ncbi:MAG: Fe-S cluster assembly protein SufD [Acidimicrobiia bacterium]
MSRFTVDATSAFEGPEWRRTHRAAAVARAAASPMPSAEEEIWRYSRIGELDLSRFAPEADHADVTLTAPVEVITDGELDDVDDPDVFDELVEAFGSRTLLRVPPGATIAETIVIDHDISRDGAAVLSRLVIEAGSDSDVTVIERFRSPDEITTLVVPTLELRVGPAARVKYLAVNELGTSSWLIARQRATSDRDSTTLISAVSLGGDYARVRTHARSIGPGASTRQIALYFADGTQMHDFRTTQEHIAPKTDSDLLFKGAVKDTARSVYTGLIKIGKEARGTAAFQTNRNLTLAEGAWAESVPNLEIETNDVKCSHASTVGPVDAEQRFYLESRGVPPEIAERLIVLGFFDEVIELLPLTTLAGEIRARVSAKLDNLQPVGANGRNEGTTA